MLIVIIRCTCLGTCIVLLPGEVIRVHSIIAKTHTKYKSHCWQSHQALRGTGINVYYKAKKLTGLFYFEFRVLSIGSCSSFSSPNYTMQIHASSM